MRELKHYAFKHRIFLLFIAASVVAILFVTHVFHMPTYVFQMAAPQQGIRQRYAPNMRMNASLVRWKEQVASFNHDSNDQASYMTLWNLLSDVENKWRNVRSDLRKSFVSDQEEPLKTINRQYIQIRRVIGNKLRKNDEQRKNKMKEVSETLQQKIEDVMNPDDCNSSRILFCGLLDDCGFGCELHFVVHCLMYALEMNRTIVFDKTLRFSKQGWEFGFLPLAKCQIEKDLKTIPALTNDVNESQFESEQFLLRPSNRYTMKYPGWHDWTIPSSLAPSLTGIHSDPFAWWIGQLVRYAMRLRPQFEMELLSLEIKVEFKNPIAGIHVRRGDKIGREADYHPVEEYMFYVALWFDQIEETKKRTVFLATDDSTVLPELKQKFPEYTFITQPSLTKRSDTALEQREIDFKGIIFDLYFLSQCDYLVCTASSNICQASYELMSTRQLDATTRFTSLDMLYHYRSFSFPYEVVTDHNASFPEEMDLQVGDVIIANFPPFGANLDGFAIGHNVKTKKNGRFPLYKARKKINLRRYKAFET